MKKIIIKLDSKFPVILIDTSYFIFHRYFSSVKWYKYKNKEIDFSTIHEDDVFITAFEKHIMNDLKKLCKTWNTNMSQLIFCSDCYRENIWRNEFIKEYKAHRVQNAEFNSHIFSKFYKYLEDNKKTWGSKALFIEKLEGDDVAYLTKKLLQDRGWTQKIIIITNDNDYLQVIDEQTHIYNLIGKGNDISKRSCGDPKLDLKIKLILGDKSDNIPSIHSGIGAITAMKLAKLSEEDLNKYLSSKKCKEVYYNNKKLIDFEMIPIELINTFKKTYNFVIT
jgi:5'-3' exonuclease